MTNNALPAPPGDWDETHKWMRVGRLCYIYLFERVPFGEMATNHLSVYQSYVDDLWVTYRLFPNGDEQSVEMRFTTAEDAMNAAMGLLL